MTNWQAFLLPLVVFSLPTYQVYAAWSVCAYFSYAALLAGGALLLTERAYESRYTKVFWLLVSLAVIMELCVLLIYQPAAMMFWFFAAIMLFIRQRSLIDMVQRLVLYLGVATPALALAYESFHVVPTMLLGQDVTSSRAQLTQDIPGKVIWFLQQPLTNALNLTDIVATYTNAIFIGAFVVIGLFLYFKGTIGLRLIKLVIALSLLPLSYLPNLVVADDWASYRTLGALGSLVALYYVLAIIGFVSLFDYVSLQHLKSVAIAIPLCLFAIYSGLFAAHNVALEFAMPQYTELQYLNSQLHPVMQQHPHVVYFVPSTWSDSIAPIVRYDEFGLPSSEASWTPIPMVYLTLQESDPADENVQVKVITEDEIKNLPAGSVVIDMHNLRYDRLALPLY